MLSLNDEHYSGPKEITSAEEMVRMGIKACVWRTGRVRKVSFLKVRNRTKLCTHSKDIENVQFHHSIQLIFTT